MMSLIAKPVMAFFHFFIQIRNLFYRIGLFKATHMPVPVVSVGNVSFGGTGKTPLTIWIAREVQRAGFPVVVLSRGYKRFSIFSRIVSDYARVRTGLRSAGDEPYLIARKLPGVPVIVSRNRVRGARKAVKRFSPRLILLDDGFQHRKIGRNFDIVLLDSPSVLHGDSLLREPVRSLRRADTVVFTKCDQYDDAEKIVQDMMQAFACSVFHAKYTPADIRNDQTAHPAEFLQGKTVFLVSGIGNPRYFKHIVERAGSHVSRKFTFRDHARYSRRRIRRILRKFETSSADMVLTTEKDWHKLNRWVPPGCRFYYLDIDISIHRSGLFRKLVFDAAYLTPEENNIE